jgi:SAM-dependent methyltransferase
MRALESSSSAFTRIDQEQKIAASPSILVAIASHGTAQDKYLRQLLFELRNFSLPVTPVVLTNQPKDAWGAEVVVGVPSADPYSLPFAHRKLFADRVNDYDLFIYTEDDMLITERHVRSFLELQPKLGDDELLGFIRSETDPDGNVYISSIHSHFRWLPATVVTRGGEVFAQLSNQHSGSFIITRAQLQKATASGGFLIPPHAGKYGMLESAATDIYLRCGFRRLLCISRIEECILPHLPNKYYKRLGIPLEEFRDGAQALLNLIRTSGWQGSLFEPQSDQFGFRWSRQLYVGPDLDLLARVPRTARHILVIGSTSGKNERWLKENGFTVTAVPLDCVFGHRLSRIGIRVFEGELNAVLSRLGSERFDVILLPGVLHLVPNPPSWLAELKCFLAPRGEIVFSVDNTSDIVTWAKESRAGRRVFRKDDKESSVQRVSVPRIRQWLRTAGLDCQRIESVLDGAHLNPMRRRAFALFKRAFATEFIVSAHTK